MFWFNPKALELLKLAEISKLEFEEEKRSARWNFSSCV